MDNFFRVRTPEVTSEDFKREVLIIDLKTGHYHSLRGVAATIWRLLDAGQSLQESILWMEKCYATPHETLEADTKSFVADLEKLGLIMAVEERAGNNAAIETDDAPYAQPTIDSYGDLQDLLLLDPIHEIAPEAGWPHRLDEV
jgi:hypothetical protein